MFSERIELPATSLATDALDQRADVRPRRQWYVFVKTGIEWLIALILLAPVAPLVAILAALVKFTSQGPAFYAQTRVGRNGRNFLMYKLRTMSNNCEAETGPVWSPLNDTRVTSVGRFLRKTHLDELPQLFNVLRGHMSLIGPRPERPELSAKIAKRLPRFHERLRLRPGLTGLAQVRLAPNPGPHPVRSKLAHDLYYIREVNPVLDLRIGLSTVLYMTGVIFQSLSSFVVKSYGNAVEPNVDAIEMSDEEDWEMSEA